jgi:hypothetical protein
MTAAVAMAAASLQWGSYALRRDVLSPLVVALRWAVVFPRRGKFGVRRKIIFRGGAVSLLM